MRLVIVIALGLAVAGCARQGTALRDAEQAFDRAIHQCAVEKGAGRIASHTAEARCLHSAVDAYRPWPHIYGPLNYMASARIAYAEAVDRGDMTVAQLNMKMAEINHQIVSDQRRQAQADDLARSARISAWGAIKPRHCQTYGNQTYCY